MEKDKLSGYGIVFKDVMCNSKLSYGARTLYAILCTYRDRETNCCYPGTDILCEGLGTNNRNRINGWIIELEIAGIVRRETRFNTLNGRKIRTFIMLDKNNTDND